MRIFRSALKDGVILYLAGSTPLESVVCVVACFYRRLTLLESFATSQRQGPDVGESLAKGAETHRGRNYIQIIAVSAKFVKTTKMKGVSFVTNDKNERIAVQIELKTLNKHQEAIEDLLDAIIAESRKDDEDVSWEDAKKELTKAGKL